MVGYPLREVPSRIMRSYCKNLGAPGSFSLLSQLELCDSLKGSEFKGHMSIGLKAVI